MSQPVDVSQPRVSVRQAVLLVVKPGAMRHGSAMGTSHLTDLDLALLLDNLGIVVGVNGVTTGVLAQSIADAALLSTALPHDVELFAPAPNAPEPDQSVVHAMEECQQRAFARIVAIRSDVIGLTVRIVSTALSSLAHADIVAGFTPHGDWYLAGVHSQAAIETLRSLCSPGLAASACRPSLTQAACQQGLAVRCVESLPCAGGLPDREALQAAAFPPDYARTAAMLRIAERAGPA